MTYAPDSAVTHIVIHYSASPIEREYTYEQLEADHIRRGFKKCGYHYYLPRKGGRRTGRDLRQEGRFEIGAHSKGENSSSIGICYEGGVTLEEPSQGFDTRTQAQKREMITLIKELLERFPGAIVKGHKDMPGAATQCPGFDAGAWWQEVQRKQNRSIASNPKLQGIITAIAGTVGTIFSGIGQLDALPQIILAASVAVVIVGGAWAFLRD